MMLDILAMIAVGITIAIVFLMAIEGVLSMRDKDRERDARREAK